MSVSCALMATSLHQWARRYIRLTQPALCNPEKRARMRAFFSNGVDKMHTPWAVEGLPTLLHLSLFLFFGGLVIFLFNVNRDVFTWVSCCIGLFSILYGLITVLPLARKDSPYYTPLSRPAWFLFASIQLVSLIGFYLITFPIVNHYKGFSALIEHYGNWIMQMLRGMEKGVEEAASKTSSEIDLRILDWTISALGDDDSLEGFFEAIPGFFKSKLVKDLETDFPEKLFRTFWHVLDGFMGRTNSSNSVTDPVKTRRVTICRDIISMMPYLWCKNIKETYNQAPPIERLRALARWFTNKDKGGYIANRARITVAQNLASIRKRDRDDDWIALARDVSGLEAQELQVHAASNILLATLIHVSRQSIPYYKVVFMM